MTPEERRRPDIIKASRRRRIALGSGTSTAEVNRLLKQFAEMQKMMKMLSGGKMPKARRRARRAARSLSAMHRLVIALVTLSASSPAPSSPGYLLLFSAATDRAAALAPAEHGRVRQRLPPAVHRAADEPRRASSAGCPASPTTRRSTRRSTRSSRTCCPDRASTTETTSSRGSATRSPSPPGRPPRTRAQPEAVVIAEVEGSRGGRGIGLPNLARWRGRAVRRRDVRGRSSCRSARAAPTRSWATCSSSGRTADEPAGGGRRAAAAPSRSPTERDFRDAMDAGPGRPPRLGLRRPRRVLAAAGGTEAARGPDDGAAPRSSPSRMACASAAAHPGRPGIVAPRGGRSGSVSRARWWTGCRRTRSPRRSIFGLPAGCSRTRSRPSGAPTPGGEALSAARHGPRHRGLRARDRPRRRRAAPARRARSASRSAARRRCAARTARSCARRARCRRRCCSTIVERLVRPVASAAARSETASGSRSSSRARDSVRSRYAVSRWRRDPRPLAGRRGRRPRRPRTAATLSAQATHTARLRGGGHARRERGLRRRRRARGLGALERRASNFRTTRAISCPSSGPSPSPSRPETIRSNSTRR